MTFTRLLKEWLMPILVIICHLKILKSFFERWEIHVENFGILHTLISHLRPVLIIEIIPWPCILLLADWVSQFNQFGIGWVIDSKNCVSMPSNESIKIFVTRSCHYPFMVLAFRNYVPDIFLRLLIWLMNNNRFSSDGSHGFICHSTIKICIVEVHFSKSFFKKHEPPCALRGWASIYWCIII